MSEELSQGIMENMAGLEESVKVLKRALSDNKSETNITDEDKTNITEDCKLPDDLCDLEELQKIFAKCQLNFHLTTGAVYSNTILLHPSKIEEFKQNIVANIEKHDATPAFTSLLCLTGSENNDMDFCLLPLKFILYFELKVLFLSKKESDTDKKTEP